MPEGSLLHTRVLVVGATGGLGAAVTAALRERGAEVAGLARGTTPSCDVTEEASVQAAVAETLERLGGLDVLIYAAGFGEPGDVGASAGSAERRMMEVNYWGAWRVMSAALPSLLASRGRVVFLNSVLAYLPTPLSVAYSASKRALAAYADGLRAEYGTHLTVSSIYPGHVDTAMHQAPRAMGASMDGKVPNESVDDVVGAVLDAAVGRVPARDSATTPLGEAGLQGARRVPGLIGAAVDARVRRLAAAGTLPPDGIGAGLVGRYAEASGRMPQDPLRPAAVGAELGRTVGYATELLRLAASGDEGLLAIGSMAGALGEQVADVLRNAPADPSEAVAVLLGPDDAAAVDRKLRSIGTDLAGVLGQAMQPDESSPSLIDPTVLAALLLRLLTRAEASIASVAERTASGAQSGIEHTGASSIRD
jgi:short-subunit dehydrogenase